MSVHETYGGTTFLGTKWEWLHVGMSRSRNIPRVACCATDDETFAPQVDQDTGHPPQIVRTFRAHGIDQSSIDAIEAADTRGALFQVTDYLGQTYTGEMLSFSYSGIQGCRLYDAASLQIREQN